jgi:ABC-2 type transport system permease protein
MSTSAHVVRDSITMLRRNLTHMRRYPSASVMVVAIPVVLLLLFVYVFGAALGTGLGASGGRAAYVEYVTPGIILIAIVGVAQGTAISVCMDMAEGIIARFRTMGISRGAVLAGHVLGSTILTMAGLAAVVAVAVAVGFRPDASAIEWVAVAGLLVLLAVAITWLSAAVGLRAKSVETASNLIMPLMLLVFIGSGFVPTDTLPGPLRVFAEYQPFTPVIETIRGLLTGTAIGNDAIWALAWCLALGVAGYRWALASYEHDPARHVRVLSAGRV